MKGVFILFGILVIVIIAAASLRMLPGGKGFLIPGFSPPFQNQQTERGQKLVIDNTTISLLVADEEKERQTGLSEKDSLSEKEGMLFLFDTPGYYQFWMRNMKFPIDIIYMQDNKIVSIFPKVPNPSFPGGNPAIYRPDKPADQVLEVTAGFVEKHNLRLGDTLKITKQ